MHLLIRRFIWNSISFAWFCAPVAIAQTTGAHAVEPNLVRNGAGITMAKVPPADFYMGSDGSSPSDYDEFPRHRVHLDHGFSISAKPITADQFKQFRMDYQDVSGSNLAEGMSWYDAKAFCDWLSSREHKHYRLPTEAEWEYLAQLPQNAREQLGVDSFQDGLPEWTGDWYGPYPSNESHDPGGMRDGWSRVVRGGPISTLLDTHADPQRGVAGYFSRPTNRASVSPEYQGRHRIGFRIVEAETNDPGTLLKPRTPFPEQFVLPSPRSIPQAAARPHLRIRNLLPVPPDNALPEATKAAGISPAIMGHIHSAGAAACDNGDVIWIAFSSLTPDSEYSPNTTFVISRLRHGSDTWDVPELFYDFADVNEQSALLWNDGSGTIHFFGGGAGLAGVPFRSQTSADCGAHWTAPQLPQLKGHLYGFATQPITSAFRKGNAIFVASDATPDTSMLWKSTDQGETWEVAGDHTRGRHTAFVALRNGDLLGMGGKNTNIDGYMPQFVSHDEGKTWSESKSPFPALNVNQRPTILRLKSGRLFFACDLQNRQGKQPATFHEHGALVALSGDEGKSWKIKVLPGVLPHEAGMFRNRKDWSPYFDDYGTLGYAVATQTPDGLIHLIGSMTHPSQEFELNEAWILSDVATATVPADGERASALVHPNSALVNEEKYPSRATASRTRGLVGSDGVYRLDGAQDWYFATGALAYHVEYQLGRKVGLEKLWSSPNHPLWTWLHEQDGSGTWTQFSESGQIRHISHWQGAFADGEALDFNEDGTERMRVEFKNGELVR